MTSVVVFYVGVIVCAAGFVALVAAVDLVAHHLEERPIRRFRDVLDALGATVAQEVSPPGRGSGAGTSNGAAPPHCVRRAVERRAVPLSREGKAEL